MISSFRSAFDAHPRVIQNPGTRVKQLYSPVVKDTGELVLEESGTEDLYGYIQSHKDSCDINLILKRFASGDVSALSRAQGLFFDATQMPKTYAELLNAVITGERYFNSLPLDVRKEFDFDFNKWMAAMDDMPSWLAKMGQEQREISTDPPGNVKSEGVNVVDEP